MDNVFELNDMRRVRNMEKSVKIYEKQLADLKQITTLCKPHREFLFFSITHHAVYEEQKKIAQELLRLRVRLDRIKNPKEILDEQFTDV